MGPKKVLTKEIREGEMLEIAKALVKRGTTGLALLVALASVVVVGLALVVILKVTGS